jgi:hypothetical protein
MDSQMVLPGINDEDLSLEIAADSRWLRCFLASPAGRHSQKAHHSQGKNADKQRFFHGLGSFQKKLGALSPPKTLLESGGFLADLTHPTDLPGSRQK